MRNRIAKESEVWRKMIIWMFTSLYPPYTGGAATDAELITHGLSDIDEITRIVLVTEYHRGAVLQRSGKRTILRILPRRDSIRKDLRSFDLVRFAVTHALIALCLIFVAVFGRRHVVHVHGRLIYSWTGRLVRVLRLRAVADVRDQFGDFRRYGSFPIATAVSLNIAKRLRTVLDSERIFVIPVPIERAKMSANTSAGIPPRLPQCEYFLFVGTLAENKGIIELVEAYHGYTAEGGALHLVIVGENRLNQALDTRGSARIHVLGSLSKEQVYGLMARADRLILPSRSEGLPRVCIEAIALNTPVVCPPCVEEFVRSCPQCVLSSISSKGILKMLKAPRESLVASGFPIHVMDAEKVVMETANVLREVAKARGAEIFAMRRSQKKSQ